MHEYTIKLNKYHQSSVVIKHEYTIKYTSTSITIMATQLSDSFKQHAGSSIAVVCIGQWFHYYICNTIDHTYNIKSFLYINLLIKNTYRNIYTLYGHIDIYRYTDIDI